MRAMRIPCIVLVIATVGAPTNPAAAQSEDGPKQPKADGAIRSGPYPKRVTFKTSDDVEIGADYFAPKAGEKRPSPAAVMVHMYPADRQSWLPLVPHLLDAGFAVLAYDIRGAGASTEPEKMDLAARYEKRDPALFADAWHDAEAAVKWLGGQKGVDAKRIAMIGASVGCSISIDFCGRSEHVKAVVCLSPGTDYMGLDSVAAIKSCGDRPILLMAPQAEREAVEKLAKAAKKAEIDIRPGGRDLHGTGIFKAEYGRKLAERIAEFAKAAVGAHSSKPSGSENSVDRRLGPEK